MSSGESTKVQSITSDEQFGEITSSIPSGALIVLYFHAPWAAPCAQMSTVLDTLASTYPISDPPKISFLSINAEELPDISEDHEVTAVPFTVLRRDGKTLETVSGSDATKLRTAVEKHAGSGDSSKAHQLPPEQKVTRPEQQPLPSAHAAEANPASAKTNGEGTSASKDLSSYAPDDSDPKTAPEYSSTTQPGLSSTSGNEKGQEESIQERLTQLTKAAPVMLFMKGTPSAPQCGFSRKLVSILRENSVRYGFFNILADEEVRQGLKDFSDWPTFPQLYMGGEFVGGLDIVQEEAESNPDFFKDYKVDTKKNMGGPAGASEQAGPTATA